MRLSALPPPPATSCLYMEAVAREGSRPTTNSRQEPVMAGVQRWRSRDNPRLGLYSFSRLCEDCQDKFSFLQKYCQVCLDSPGDNVCPPAATTRFKQGSAPSEIFSIIPSQQFDNHSIESSNDPLGTIQSPLETQDIRTSGRILSMYYEYIIEQILPSSRIYFSVIYDRFI